MALADMYKQNNVSYYGSGHTMSGIFSDTIDNLTANAMIDYSIFLNTGSTWSMKNTGTIGNHFAWYADWVGGVLAVRKGPDVIGINYLGSAILSKNTGCTVANLSAKQADGAGWNDFKKARFMIDAINSTPGTAGQYNAFNYVDYTGLKFGFNSCFIQSTAGYATSNTSYSYTQINDYTTLTGDNAKRIVFSDYIVMLTAYNPYLTDNANIDKQDIGYIWDFFDIGGEIVCVRDILRMPNSAHWQSWAYYHDVTDKYVTIGGFGGNVVAGTQGALPESDDVKGIYSYNHNGTSANWFVTKNAVDFKTNSMGLRWCVGNTTISTAKQWRDNVRLGVMNSTGVITHNQWIVGESAIQASDNPNKNTDYDHIPAHGGGGGETGDDYADMSLGVSNVTLGGLTKYAILSKQELINLVIDYNTNGSAAGTNFSNHIICLYRLGFGASDLVVTSSDKIKMIQSAGNVDFESSANYSIVTRQTPFIHFGSIKVPRHTNTFYDFSPYSSYELYIPGCGWIPLPDNVAGRTLNVYLVFDLPTCSAKGIVRIEGGVYGGTTIATVNGVIGASVPFTIGENGMQRAAIMSANAQVAAGIATGIVGATINPMLAVAGGAELVSGVIGAYTAGNTNYISTKGGASDFSAFGDGATAMLKFNSPEIDPVVNNTMFGHTVGYLCNEVGKLSTFSGFTVCDNPHVTFSASSAERDEIERLLASGVIL